ncbi:MAG: hypothetical protein IKI95_03215 [Clostridia bacterium]|nr:hypothetical protein [Clostridia bacterium]
MDWLTNWIFELLYSLQKTICYIIDFIREIFYMLAGLEPVNIEGEQTDLLSHFILSDTVRTAFFYIFLVAIILLVVFVMIAIIRSEYAHGENKRPKGQILAKAFQSFAIFLMVPFILIAGITLTNAVMGAINASMNPYLLEGGSATIGGQILVTSGQYAYIGDEAIRSQIERMFVTGELSYFDMGVVSQYYNLRSLDFLVGILGSIVIMVMFVMSAVTFIQRIFDIVLLYIISPVSVSTIPVDDGNRFRIWRDMTISKVLGAYGIILSMNLFFLIIPQVATITFFADPFKNGIVQILFLIGGAFAVTKANLVIAQLTGSTAGQNETQQLFRNMQTGGHIAKATLGAGATVGGALLGGKRFVDTKKSTRSFAQGFKNSFGSPTSKPYMNKAEPSKLARYGGMPSRIATMPIGMIKDLTTGGVVGMGKNFIPRIKNIATGDSFVNHAQGKSILNKEPTNANNSEEHKG